MARCSGVRLTPMSWISRAYLSNSEPFSGEKTGGGGATQVSEGRTAKQRSSAQWVARAEYALPSAGGLERRRQIDARGRRVGRPLGAVHGDRPVAQPPWPGRGGRVVEADEIAIHGQHLGAVLRLGRGGDPVLRPLERRVAERAPGEAVLRGHARM